jgi:ankyrin repeat protein
MRASGAGDIAEIQRQLATGADPNAQDCSGWTALMYAALPMKSEAIAFLLRAGADVNATSRMGQTALMAASLTFSGTAEKVELLLAASAHKDARDARNMNAFDYFDSTARNWPSTRTEEYEKVRLLLK